MLKHCHTPSEQVDVLMPVDSWLMLNVCGFDDGKSIFGVMVLVLQLHY